MIEQVDDVPEGVDPPRLKFYEEVQLAFQKTVDSLCRSVPEFSGATISLVWDMSSSQGLPHGLIQGRQVNSPQFTLRAAEQTNKTLQNLVSSFMNQLVSGDTAAQELNSRIAASQQELNDLQKKIKEKQQELTGYPADDAGITAGTAD